MQNQHNQNQQNPQQLESVNSFDQLSLKENLLRGIFSNGLVQPSSIQQKAIKPLIQGQNLIVQEQPSSGKTTTFIIGTLQVIDNTSPLTQALILAPSIELAQQISTTIQRFGEYLKVTVQSFIDGTDINLDSQVLQNQGIQIVVGTPKKVLDLISNGSLQTDNLKSMVIDEADYIFSHDHQNIIKEILKLLPINIQKSFFSIPMPQNVVKIAENYLNNHIKITENNLLTINQFYIPIEKEEYKIHTIQEIYCNLNIAQAIIFVNNQQKVQQVVQILQEGLKMNVSYLHDQVQLEERQQNIQQFKNCQTKILVTTDNLLRGLDFQSVTLIINYDLPSIHFKQHYFNRISRSTRFERTGTVINLALPDDNDFLQKVQQEYQIQINKVSEKFSNVKNN